MKKNILLKLNFALIGGLAFCQMADAQSTINLSVMAKPSTTGGGRGGGPNTETLNAIINGVDPQSSTDRQHGAFTAGGPRGGGNGRRNGGAAPAGPSGPQTNWVQLEWTQPVSTKQIEVYWFTGGGRGGGGRAVPPTGYRLKYWKDNDFVPVENTDGLGVATDKYNTTTFSEVTTSRLRLEFDTEPTNGGAGILQWKVIDSGKTPNFAPVVAALQDRDVMVGGKTYLSGSAKDEGKPSPLKLAWAKESGPGPVNFENAGVPETTATFTTPGDYVLQLIADDGDLKASQSLKVKVDAPPPLDRLDVVYTKNYKINSPLWNARAKALIVSWIPHCIDQINSTNLREGPGGIDNFIEAAKALKGEPHARHKGYVFANAWVHQTVESMSIALMIDPQGDKQIIAAQAKMKATLDDWIPKILAAQEPDGYLQTAITLGNGRRWTDHGAHEGYTGGYFIESAINHYTMTGGKDKRLYDAAKKLADCWYDNLGPAPKKAWYDGHQEMEQALVRFGRFVNDMEGPGSHGDHYIQLAKFLLDSREGGTEYDLSHLPVIKQYEVVGHAVRAAYTYSGMADVAAETHDPDYQSAVMSLWDNLVNKKYYVTGGIGEAGPGDAGEGFGPNYALNNRAYCESCSTCGLIFFQWKMDLAYHDAKYADLYEESMYNALLGATDLKGETFFYTNPLQDGNRTAWHACPCCVGNIPRTLLMIPTWTYAKTKDGVYVNMFIGSTINVEKVAGTDIEMVQNTDYPWKGDISITVNPKASKQFSVFVRIPNRTTSELYTPTPEVSGYKSLMLNGKPVDGKVVNGYVEISRTWKKGDKIDLVLPMEVQRIKADPKINADRGLVALRYGPLIYNVERADHQDISQAIGSTPLTAVWEPKLLGGVMAIKGTWADGSPLLAIPNYARLNPRDATTAPVAAATAGGDASVDYSGATGGTVAASTNAAAAGAGGGRRGGGGRSSVWIRDSAGGTP